MNCAAVFSAVFAKLLTIVCCLLFAFYSVYPNAMLLQSNMYYFHCISGFTFCDYVLKKCITIESEIIHPNALPTGFFYAEETQPDTAHYFSVWKIKCHRLLFGAQSPIYLHPVYFGESEGFNVGRSVVLFL